MENINETAQKFAELIKEQLERVERMKQAKDFIDYSSLDKIVIGVCGGDGIGPFITAHAQHILESTIFTFSNTLCTNVIHL